MKPCDLQIHTNYSDGELTPQQVVDIAVDEGLYAIAVTDHNEFRGSKTALEYAKEKNIKVIPAIELSTSINSKPTDILGFNISYEVIEKELVKLETLFKEERKLFLEKAFKKFEELGYKVPRVNTDNLAFNRTENVYYLVCEVLNSEESNLKLFDKRFPDNKGNRDWYLEYMVYGKPVFLTGHENLYEQTIDIIKSSGGYSFIAHPRREQNYTTDDEILEMKEYGLDGLEVYYPSHTKEQENHLYNLAKENNMFISGGSDFHRMPSSNQIGSTTISFSKIEEWYLPAQ